MYSGALMSAKLRQAAMAAAGPALPHRSETLKPRRSQARRQWSIQAVKGKVTTRCLWNACKALTIGVLLILVGAAMATIGKSSEQKQKYYKKSTVTKVITVLLIMVKKR